MSVIDETMRPMLDTFIFETTTLLDQLDEILLVAEKAKSLTDDQINEIFRAMHTVKGSAAMMGLSDMSEMTHRVEDMFFIIRENPEKLDGKSTDVVFDILFQATDYLRSELGNIQEDPDGYQPGSTTSLTGVIESEIAILKGEAVRGEATPAAAAETPPEAPSAAPSPAAAPSEPDVHTVRVHFEDGCQMENVRAFMLMNQLQEYVEILATVPENPETNPDAIKDIVDNGFVITFRYPGEMDGIFNIIEESTNIASYEEVMPEEGAAEEAKPEAPAANVAEPAETQKAAEKPAAPAAAETQTRASAPGKQSLISVNQTKIDSLVNIMGEIVIAESMVASNPDLKDLPLDNFNKSARQLRKLTDQLQDIVMGIRMVPLTGTFQKMQRIVRDMNKNLGKDTELVTVGGETEVDKSITDVLADPLMHMIRNSMDHGIETPEERTAAGKSEQGKITLSAQNVGSDIIIKVEDDGQGLNREKLLDKAERNGILMKPRGDYSDKEAFGLIMMPGFSTNEVVTEYSGRGVGMDVVRKNIEKVGGTVTVESVFGEGTSFIIKIPLTLAIVDGMEIGVANDTFTIPITSISQIYKLSPETELLYDTDGTEMVMVRGECYPIIRLHRIYNIDDAITDLTEGIMIIVESGESRACIFTDKLIGEQQVVVKSFPSFFNRYNVKDLGFSGCTIMGDGSISLILDINCLLGAYRGEGSGNLASMSFA
ncbi:chemotaxis protein CheA [Ruminococcaceae bacterium OttesenSCG-928-I18]|nr:chemotaxis protein CheA [Ruminococcaceae bacterium OttesenSCG-928-I18]